MKLYETFGKRGFHTSIATSFGVDFDAYENVMLSRFKGAGCYNNMLVVDNGMLSLALEDGRQLPEYAGRTYTVTPAAARGVFHPKIVLQIGRSSARMGANSTSRRPKRKRLRRRTKKRQSAPRSSAERTANN
jgi:hypothetical protein